MKSRHNTGLFDSNPPGAAIGHSFWIRKHGVLKESKHKVRVRLLGLLPSQIKEIIDKGKEMDRTIIPAKMKPGHRTNLKWLCNKDSGFLEYGNIEERKRVLKLWEDKGQSVDLNVLGGDLLRKLVKKQLSRYLKGGSSWKKYII